MSQLLNHLSLENAHSGSICTTIISRHYKSGLFFFLKEKCVPFTALTMAPFFSTPSHKTHLSLLFRRQSGCSELMESRVLDWECQSFTCHPCIPLQGDCTPRHTHRSNSCSPGNSTHLFIPFYCVLPQLFSPLSSLRKTSPASFHPKCESDDSRKAQVSLLRVRAGDKSVSEKRETFPL